MLATQQVNPGCPTPLFASVATLAVLALPLTIALTRTFVLAIITVFQYDDVVFHILSEEAQAYYQGAVPAQTAAENIQQRLQNWLDEQQ